MLRKRWWGFGEMTEELKTVHLVQKKSKLKLLNVDIVMNFYSWWSHLLSQKYNIKSNKISSMILAYRYKWTEQECDEYCNDYCEDIYMDMKIDEERY